MRDPAGCGYRVELAEMNGFASATSSASTKLFHGGVRNLEYRESLLVTCNDPVSIDDIVRTYSGVRPL